MQEEKHAPESTGDDQDVPPPVGTLFVVMIYLMVMAGMWGGIYVLYIGR